MKILVLGHKGMLGHMVYKYFIEKNFEVSTTSKRWPSSNFKDFIYEFNGDYIVNCIANIPQKKSKNFDINVDFPIWLDDKALFYNMKIIHKKYLRPELYMEI